MTFISELLPDSDHTGGRPRDATSCVKERNDMLLNYETFCQAVHESNNPIQARSPSNCVRKQYIPKVTNLTDA